MGLDFHQIHAGLFGQGQSLGAAEDSDLFAFGINDAYPRYADFLVAAVAFVVDGADSQSLQWFNRSRGNYCSVVSSRKRWTSPDTGMAPRSSPLRVRTAIVPCAISRSPATSR